MDNSNLEIKIELLKKDFEYLKLDAKNKDIYLKDAVDKINNKLDDDERIHRIINKKFDEENLKFRNKYYAFFYTILGTAVALSVTIYKTFIK
jgi:ribosome maturation factor RimP